MDVPVASVLVPTFTGAISAKRPAEAYLTEAATGKAIWFLVDRAGIIHRGQPS